MTFIVKLGQSLLKNCIFSLQKPLFLCCFVATFYNITLILHVNNAWIFVSISTASFKDSDIIHNGGFLPH